ncbi:F-box/kelch-repeat protein [Carex littledalei]|uniref:F-box/kelch-repeat protein n=1 Tax=Carex littledalei TaxID=544730 RepID=A0A833VKR6_9POAL|nr:F-box/kelch-repeat protein [Carex littledalei]
MKRKKEAATGGRGRGRDHDHDHDDDDDDKQRPWSDLLPELVFTIVKQISFLDRRNAKFAFPEWGSTINEASSGPFLLSYVPLFEIRILDPIDKIRYVLRPSRLPHEVMFCSIKHGWLLLCDIFWRSFFFYNPFSHVVIELPPNEQSLFGSFCFSTLPTSSQCIVLVEEFKRDHIRFIFCSPGDRKWKELYISQENIFSAEDGNAIFYKGKIYLMATEGKLGVFDLTTESWFVHDNPNAGISEPVGGINYLVESDNNLFRVWTKKHPLIHFQVAYVRVYKLDESKHVWKETRSLGGRCFFVSYNPLSIETVEEFRGEQDVIYFAGETTQVGSFSYYDVRHACMNFSEGAYIQHTFYQNSCWVMPKWDCSSPGEEH